MSAPAPAGKALAVGKTPGDRNGLQAIVARMEKQILAVGSKYVTPAAVLALTLDAAGKDGKLLKCTTPSLMRSLVKVARLGLTIGEDIDLVPLDSRQGLRCEAWVRYQGLKKLLKRANIIRDMWERCVYEKELPSLVMEYGLEEKLIHKPILVGERGPLVGAYSRIQLPFGRSTFHYMSLDEIEAIRAGSRSWSPKKFATCPDWYAMKTVVRDWSARQPLSPELQLAVASDDAALDEERPDGVTDDGEIVDADFTVEDGDAQEPQADA